MKITVNYARSEMQIPFEQAIDLASAEDDDRRLKLAHHPDGLVQFSGEGILSGIDTAGHIRGVGVHSWPLDTPVTGPAFSVVIRGVEEFQPADRIRDELCLFTDAEVFLEPGADLLSLEGYYFPPLWRRFVRPMVDGAPTISVVHPAGAVLRLKVLLPPARCEHQGFLAVELYGYQGDSETPSPSFMLSSSTGNLRRNEQGETVADGIYCVYPRGPVGTRRVVDYQMAAVPPQPSPEGIE